MKSFEDMLQNATRLSRKAMKDVSGGGTVHGTCAFMLSNGYIMEKVPKDLALDMVNEYGGRWCCDSCDKATWLQ